MSQTQVLKNLTPDFIYTCIHEFFKTVPNTSIIKDGNHYTAMVQCEDGKSEELIRNICISASNFLNDYIEDKLNEPAGEYNRNAILFESAPNENNTVIFFKWK